MKLKIKQMPIFTITIAFAIAISIIIITTGAYTTALADGTLTIEVGSTDASPGDIIDIPIYITTNPGVSVIKDLRIDLSRGLNFHFPQGITAYTNSGTIDTWPYQPEKTEYGTRSGMLPVMGRPTAANISNAHIVFNFLDTSLPFDSTATGTLITLKIKVDEEATGEISVNISGGKYSDITLQGDETPILIGGVVNTGQSDDSTGTTNPADETPPVISVPDDVVSQALQEETPYVRLTEDMGTHITSQTARDIVDAGTPVTFELPDGTLVEFYPADIPIPQTGFDLTDLPPGAGTITAAGAGDSQSSGDNDAGSDIISAVILIIVLLGCIALLVMASIKDYKGAH